MGKRRLAECRRSYYPGSIPVWVTPVICWPPPKLFLLGSWRCYDAPHRFGAQGPAHLRHPASAHRHHYTCSRGPLRSPPALTSLLVALETARCHPQEDRWEHSESVFKGHTLHYLRASKSGLVLQVSPGQTACRPHRSTRAGRPLPGPHPGLSPPEAGLPGRPVCLPHSRHHAESGPHVSVEGIHLWVLFIALHIFVHRQIYWPGSLGPGTHTRPPPQEKQDLFVRTRCPMKGKSIHSF